MQDQEKVAIKIVEPTVIAGIGVVGRGDRKVTPKIARELFAANKAVPVEDKGNPLMNRDHSLNGSGYGETGDE